MVADPRLPSPVARLDHDEVETQRQTRDRATVRQLSAAQLDEQIGTERNRSLGTGVTRRETIHGILQHDAYHLGQIALLKRALR